MSAVLCEGFRNISMSSRRPQAWRWSCSGTSQPRDCCRFEVRVDKHASTERVFDRSAAQTREVEGWTAAAVFLRSRLSLLGPSNFYYFNIDSCSSLGGTWVNVRLNCFMMEQLCGIVSSVVLTVECRFSLGNRQPAASWGPGLKFPELLCKPIGFKGAGGKKEEEDEISARNSTFSSWPEWFRCFWKLFSYSVSWHI